MDPVLWRSLALLLPALAAAAVWWPLRGSDRLAGGALLATLWQLPALLLLEHLNKAAGWWSYHVEGGLVHGMPADFWLGWAIFWGAIPVLVLRRLPLATAAVIMVSADLVGMPLLSRSVTLHDGWLAGEAVGLGIGMLPGLCLGRWTAEQRRLGGRLALQVTAFAALLLWVVPSVILEQTGASWETALRRPLWCQALFLTLVLVAAVPGLAAVQEFMERGAGTPVPFDPPRRLVTTGPYAYLANPMQSSTMVVLLIWGAWTGSPWVATAGIAAFCMGAGLFGWNEAASLRDRFGEAWEEWRRAVRKWRPRLTPHVTWPAVLHVAESCTACRHAGSWFRRRQPVGLTIAPAEARPAGVPARLTYDMPGWTENGLGAFARGLGHLHLGWAWIGWMLRLPVIRHVLQGVLDLTGGGPRQLPPAGS